MYSLVEEASYPYQDIGVYLQPQDMRTSYHCEFSLPYNPENKNEANRMEKLFTTASEEFSGMGTYFSRPYGIWSKL
ncbi:hypothetical protein [Anaerovirgula multivorans]|uniref:hypothetical protein n=1 Tax=Anaerovirgula multivorans TaxID=312168 RepID=UPI000B7809F9|nr:hypothetical protein [Anaerovirgula multivorans]